MMKLLTRHLQRWCLFYATIVIGHCLKENFPFSNWPMYATFGPTSYYVYVADGRGIPIPHKTTLRDSSARLKKQFHSEVALAASWMRSGGAPISKQQAQHRAGLRMLTRLSSRLSPEEQARLGGLQLFYVTITDIDRELVRAETKVAEITLGPAAATEPTTSPEEQ